MKTQAFFAMCAVSIALGQDAWSQRMSRANLLQQQGAYAEAGKLYQEAVAESKSSKHFSTGRYAQASNNLAAHYYEIGNYAAAEPLYRKAVQEWQSLGNNPGRLGVSLANLATLYRKTGRYDDAIATFREAGATLTTVYGAESAEVVSCLVNWAEAYRSAGRVDDAQTTAAKALQTAEKIFPVTDARISHALHAYATILQTRGRAAETTVLHQRALAIREKSYGSEHPYVAASLSALVSLYLEQGRYADAEPLAIRALAIWESKLGPEHPNVGVALNNLAQVHRLQQKHVEAEPLYRRAVQVLEKQQSPEVVKPLGNLGDFHFERGRTTAALAYYKRSEEVARAAFGDSDPQTTAAQLKIAKVYESMGRRTEAARLYKAVEKVRSGQALLSSSVGRP